MTSYSRACGVLSLFLLFLFLFANVASADTYIFPASELVNCTTSLNTNCSLIDPVLWNGTVPSTSNDALYIIYNETEHVTLYLSNSLLNLSLISISGSVSLQLEAGAHLEVFNLTLTDGASLVVLEASSVRLNGTAHVDAAGIILNGLLATYDQFGGWLWLTNTSTISTSANSTLSLSSAVIVGDLFLDANSQFYVGNAITFNKSSIINAPTSLNQVILNQVAVNFTNGVSIGNLRLSTGSQIGVIGTMSTNTLFIEAGGVLQVFGDLLSDNITAYAPITINGTLRTTYLVSFAPMTISGQLNAANASLTGASVTVLQGVFSDILRVATSSSLTVFSGFYVSSFLNVTNSSRITLQAVQGSINSTILGAGDIYINASVIALNSSYTLPNARLTFEGTSTLTAPRVNPYPWAYANGDARVNLNVNNIALNQSGVLPISLTVTNGAFTSTGGTAVVGAIAMSFVRASIQGYFAPHGGMIINSTVMTIGEGTSINGTTLIVNSNSTLSCLFTTPIYSQIVNNGRVITSAINPVAIYGGYTQQRSATLQIDNIDRNLKAFVSVFGVANIAGDLQYQPIVIASGESAQLPVLVTNGGLNGRFNNPTRPFETHIYQKNNMYILFSEKSGGAKLYLSWVFVVVLIISLL